MTQRIGVFTTNNTNDYHNGFVIKIYQHKVNLPNALIVDTLYYYFTAILENN